MWTKKGKKFLSTSRQFLPLREIGILGKNGRFLHVIFLPYFPLTMFPVFHFSYIFYKSGDHLAAPRGSATRQYP